jgi:hypothetical protein
MTQMINAHNDLAYCSFGCGVDIGQPVQDVSGAIPGAPSLRECTDRAAKALSKLRVALLKCHVSSSRAQRAGQAFDEEGCEQTAAAKYDATTPLPGDCTACLTSGGYVAARDLTRALIDNQIGGPYCASPSGAF